MTFENRQFYELESNLDLFDWKIEDCWVWDRIRFDVFREIQEQSGVGTAHTPSPSGMIAYGKGIILFLKNLFIKNPFLAGRHNLACFGHQRRKLESDDYWWDIYLDPIYETCDLEKIHMEYDYQRGHLKPPKTDKIKYLDLIRYGGILQKKLGISRIRLSSDDKDRIKKLQQSIKQSFDVHIDVEYMIKNRLRNRKVRGWLLDRLLDQLHPTLVVVVNSYGRHDVIEACQRKSIPVVELQHGTINSNHMGYHFPNDRLKKIFPDYLLVWGEFWKDQCEFPIPNDRVIPAGFPYLEQMKTEYNLMTKSEQLLFISQGTIGKDLSKLAIEVSEHPDIDHDIVYKLHPGEYDRWKEEYPWLVDADFEIIDSSKPPLYELFAKSSVQVGVYSTAVYEGLAFDLETYVYDCSGSDVLEPLVEEGSAELISSADDLAASLGTNQNSFESEYYFAPNATETMCEVLERLANEGTQYRQQRC